MVRTIAIVISCSVFFLAQSRGQEVFVPRQPRAVAVPQSEPQDPPEASPVNASVAKGAVASSPFEEVPPLKTELAKVSATNVPAPNPRLEKLESAKVESTKAPGVKKLAAAPSDKATFMKASIVKESSAKPQPERVQLAKADSLKVPITKEPLEDQPLEKSEQANVASVKVPPARESAVDIFLSSSPVETASTRLADGFDFPVGKPEAEGYYKARGFRAGGHVGEDWDGVRGGDTDFKDPIYCIGHGVVVFARDVRRGWGNVVIVRHGYREKGGVQYIDSLYGHLNTMLVKRGQKVTRGQQIGTMGTAHGHYDAHLHLEIRKNIEIGMSRAKFQRSLSNYHDPSQFIASHRRIAGGGENFRVAMNTFTHDFAFRFDDAAKLSSRKRSSSESR